MHFDLESKYRSEPASRGSRARTTVSRWAYLAAVLAALASPTIGAQAPTPAPQPPPAATKVRAVPENEPQQTPLVELKAPEVPLAPGDVHRFEALVTGTTNQRVTWTSTGGTIAADGTYTAGTTPGTFTVTGTITGGTVFASIPVVVAGATVSTTYMSDRPWASMANGWGPVELDRSNGENGTGDGRTLTLNGVTYAKGLGAHAASDVRYALKGACSTFTAVVGVDDEMATNGSVVFQVWTDGTKRFDSGVMTAAMAGAPVSVSMSGVSELALIVTDGGNGVASDHADWADARVSCSGTASFLSDRTWTSSTSGWGPVEKDRSNGENGAGDGRAFALNGATFAKGLGVHAPSDIRYALNDSCYNFWAVIGVDDETGTNGSVVFQVWADNVKRYDSGLMKNDMPGKGINIPMVGVIELALVVTDGGDGAGSDHADWADAQVTCSADTTAPTITSTSPASGGTGSLVDGNVTATLSEPMLATSLTTATMQLVPRGGTAAIPAAVTYDATARTVTLNPTVNLTAGAAYTATIKGGSSGARDNAGNAMAVDKVWTFTTAAPPQTVTVTPATASVANGATQQFAAAVTGSGSATLVWSATGGTITTSGLYTAGAVAGSFVVRATLGTLAGTAQATVVSARTITTILPGENIQTRVDATPAGTAFLLKAGIYRNQTVSPRTNDSYSGEPGTILNGSRVLTGAVGSNPWYYTGQTQDGGGIGECEAGWGRCVSPEEVFIDNVRIRHAETLSDVGPGRWFFDYAADRIYIGDNPSGHTVETSVTPKAFNPTGTGVTITGMVIEKYASQTQSGTIDCGFGCKVSNNELRLNHGMGVRPATNSVISGNNIHHNGHMGIGGGGIWADESNRAARRVGTDVVVENNEIAFNNAAHFNFLWEAGGMKLVNTDRAIVRGNYVHDNQGPGLWSDIDNINILYEKNNVVKNAGPGIFHEIGWKAVIRNNTITGNGWGSAFFIYGAGILVSESTDVEVYGNTLDRNYDGICGVFADRGGTSTADGGRGTWQLRNLNVHDNDVTMLNVSDGEQTSFNGIVTTYHPEVFTTMGNLFKNNHYHIPNPAAAPIYGNFFAWSNAARSFASWQGYGQEAGGTVVSY